MGDFRIEISAVGAHGCARETKDGERVQGCGLMRCPDCLTAKFVADLARVGSDVKAASLTHWPNESCAVVDTFEPLGPYQNTCSLAKRTRCGQL